MDAYKSNFQVLNHRLLIDILTVVFLLLYFVQYAGLLHSVIYESGQ